MDCSTVFGNLYCTSSTTAFELALSPDLKRCNRDGSPWSRDGSRDERGPRGDWYYWCMQEEAARSAIDTFISAFNASDDSYVTALLSQALTSDVVFWGPLGRSEGIAAVERFVLDIRRHPAGTGTMVRCSAVDMPDEWARYQWVFTTPDEGPRLAGTDIVHLRRSLIDQIIVFAGETEPSAVAQVPQRP